MLICYMLHVGNKSYPIDVDPQTLLTPRNSKSWKTHCHSFFDRHVGTSSTRYVSTRQHKSCSVVSRQVEFGRYSAADLSSTADHEVQTGEPRGTHRPTSSVSCLLGTRQTVSHLFDQLVTSRPIAHTKRFPMTLHGRHLWPVNAIRGQISEDSKMSSEGGRTLHVWCF